MERLPDFALLASPGVAQSGYGCLHDKGVGLGAFRGC